GGSVNMQLILREVATAGETASQIVTMQGINQADVKVGWLGGGAFVADPSHASTGPGLLPIGPPILTATDVFMNQEAGSPPASGVTGTPGSGTNLRNVELGTLTFTSTATKAVTDIMFSDPDAGNNLTLGGYGTGSAVLDGAVSYGSGTITNPEPGTFILGGIGAATLLGHRLRRRRKQREAAREEEAT
ncbi:MAG TPA: hypothetical protein QF564_11985, partial [Pirellulaceae bacterium]|nr:hypothetical protein [Pirellulaceae bacterium]